MNGPQARIPEPPSSILAKAQAARFVMQVYRPLATSIEWELGQRYYQDRGNKAFINDAIPIPFAINNDGTLSNRAAELFFESLTIQERTSELGREIFVLELGIGVGLFARFFLDSFRDLCDEHDKDYYERLCYVAGDRSEQMLVDACRHGVFSNHAGHYILRQVDALDPESDLRDDLRFADQGDRPFRAVFLNYLLDCLPAAIFERNGETMRQLCVRTCLARGVDLSEHTELSAEEIAIRANSPSERDRFALGQLYDLFASEYAYFPVDVARFPHGEFAANFERPRSRYILHNYGAVQCIERVFRLIKPNGFILTNDYGYRTVEDFANGFEHQRFSGTTAVGINFELFRGCLQKAGVGGWTQPTGEDGHIYTRLLAQNNLPELSEAFQRYFDKPALERLRKPVEQAHTYLQQGRFELAVSAYQEALERQPTNWLLMSEIARLLTFSLKDAASGFAMIRSALALNPSCSSDLWNDLGDSLVLLERFEEARFAFLRAATLNRSDPRSRYNLAIISMRDYGYELALTYVAEGMGADELGRYQEGFLKVQTDILQAMERRRRQRRHLIANRISSVGHNDLTAPAARTSRPAAAALAWVPTEGGSANKIDHRC